MGMPVKLSDQLVTQARKEAGKARRSMTAQVEHWARIGRAAESSMPPSVVERLKDNRRLRSPHPALSFFERISEADMRRAAEHNLGFLKHPRYESDPHERGVIVAVHENGRRVSGRWDMRRNVFVPGALRRRRG